MTQERVKITMYRTHLAYIDRPFLQAFDQHCQVVNFAAWIRQQAEEDFGLVMTNADDLMQLSALVTARYYSDKTEWLRDKMRIALLEHTTQTPTPD